MKFFVVMSFVCLMGGSVWAQDEVEKKVKPPSLVDLIVESEAVFELKSIDENYIAEWEILAGNEKEGVKYRFYYFAVLGEKKLKNLRKYYEETPGEEIKRSVNITLFASNKTMTENYVLDIHSYKAEFYQQKLGYAGLRYKEAKFPKYAGFREDIIWLCKNRYLLKLIKKGELTAETYIFDSHELQFLVIVCPEEYLKGLHKYANTQKSGEILKMLYNLMHSDPLNSKKFPLLNKQHVQKLIISLDDQLDYQRLLGDLRGACKELNEKLKGKQLVSWREEIILKAALRRKADLQPYRNELVMNLKNRIMRDGEIELLKVYLHKMELRKSEVDLVHLAELVQSKTFLEGEVEFQALVMEQFARRKEKEVVWILAPFLKHKDTKLAAHTRIILFKLVSKDLGNDPKDWRKWYKEQNK